MKKRIQFLLMIFFLLATNIAYSQVQVILDQPPPFQFKTEDLWKVTLTNPGNSEQVYLFGTVGTSTRRLVDARTGVFTLPQGMKRVNARELSPIDVTKYSDEVENTLNKTGTFQTGVYNICVYVYSASTNQELGSTCSEYEVLNLTEPELIFPDNKDVVRELQPVFNWLPPTPSPGYKALRYDIVIKEILERQTGISAMTSNPVYFTQRNLVANVFQYPLAAAKLVSGRKYTWVVRTYINNYLYNESEVYEFTYQSPFDNIGKTNDSLRSTISSPQLTEEEKTVEFKKQKEIEFAYNTNNIRRFEQDLSPTESMEKVKPFEFKYDLNSEYKYLNRIPTGSDLMRNTVSVDFVPQFIFYGLPISLNLYYDNQQNKLMQNINSFAFLFDLQSWKDKLEEDALSEGKKRMSSFMKVINAFNTIGLGDVYPNYSKYTLNGTKLTGADFEFNPGIFYLAVSGIKNLDPIEKQSFRRFLAAGRTGVGSKDGSHFHLTFLKAWDSENSITDFGDIAPQENIVMGTSGKLKLFKDKLEIGGEINGSMLTRDKTAPDLVSEDFPAILSNLLDPKISSQFDFMYEVGAKFNNPESDTKVEAGFKSIGPGYISLGSPGLRKDINAIKFKVNQSFMEKLIQAGITVESEWNNIANLNRTTSNVLKMGFSLRMNFEDIPYIIIDYRPYSSSNDDAADSVKLESKANVLTLITGINEGNKYYQNSASFMLSYQGNKTTDKSNDFSILTLLFSDNVTYLKVPLSVGGSLSYTNKSGMIGANTFALDLYSTYTFFDIWSNTLGFNFTEEKKRNNKKGFYITSDLSLEKWFRFGVSVEQNYYRESVFEYGNSDDLMIRLNFARSF